MPPLPSALSRLSAQQIRDEFGQKPGSYWRVGDYRKTINLGGVNWPVDDGIPTSGTIRFSDFHSKQHNVVIVLSGNTGYRQQIIANRSSADSTAYRDSSRSTRRTSKNTAYIIRTIGSAQGSRSICALKTGNNNDWFGGSPNGAKVLIRVGSGGGLYGAGGDGGRGGTHSESGEGGGNGSSALGLEVNVESVTVDSGGTIQAGSGGGGGGGGARETSAKNRKAGGGGGGGGAGLPSGERGRGRNGNRRTKANGRDGDDGTLNNGGDGGKGSDNDEEAGGGGGGGGGAVNGQVGEAGPGQGEGANIPGEAGKTNGDGGDGGRGEATGSRNRGETSGGNGGDHGYAITRSGGISQPTLNGSSRMHGQTNASAGVR